MSGGGFELNTCHVGYYIVHICIYAIYTTISTTASSCQATAIPAFRDRRATLYHVRPPIASKLRFLLLLFSWNEFKS